jgi:hypothetical protein
MTDNDNFDDILAEAARSYNEPPEVPRDEMWARIAEARAGRAKVVPIAARRRWTAGRIAQAVAGIAAVLLVGVLLGRYSAPTNVIVAEGQRAVDTARGDTQVVAVAAPDSMAAEREPRSSVDQERQSGVEPPVIRSPEQRVSTQGSRSTPLPDEPRRNGVQPNLQADLYRLAAIEHFGRTEALLTEVRAESQRGTMDERIGQWARDLLSKTRLLLDSPAGDDPQMKMLLEDLEVLLAKLARHAGAGAEDSKIIDDALSRSELLDRIRTVPAGVISNIQGD